MHITYKISENKLFRYFNLNLNAKMYIISIACVYTYKDFRNCIYNIYNS